MSVENYSLVIIYTVSILSEYFRYELTKHNIHMSRTHEFISYVTEVTILRYNNESVILLVLNNLSFLTASHTTFLLFFSVGLPVANAPDVLQPRGLLYYP
jgi:hypothetical protein